MSPAAASHKIPRILIVDDDAGQRSLLDSFLTGQGFATTVVSSGEEALDALKEDGVDMMISDVRMPGTPGPATLPRARGRPQRGVCAGRMH